MIDGAPRTPRLSPWAGLAVLLALAALPWLADDYYLRLGVRLIALGIFAMSLDLLVGYTGLVSFGHAAFFGLAGYILALMTPAAEPSSLWIVLPASILGVAVFATIIGWFSVRTTGASFIMITLAFAQILFFAFHDNPRLGGSDGLFMSHRPVIAFGSWGRFDLENRTTLFYLTLAALVGSYLMLAALIRAPFGRVLRAIQSDEVRARALGYRTQRYKLASFVVAATVAGLAGFLEACNSGFVNPASLGWHESGFALITVVLGGSASLYGPVLGALVLGLLQDVLQDLTRHWLLALGLFVIACVLATPRGIVGLIEGIARRLGGRRGDEAGRR